MYSDMIGEIYNGFYSMSDNSGGDRGMNSIGWISSFTGLPYSAEEMTEWRDNTLKIIKSFRHTKIFEAACGTGMMLFGLIGDAEKYTGIDVAVEGIRYISSNLTPDEKVRTELHAMSIENIDTLDGTDYDLAFINSATQYMGPADEFTECIRKLTDKVREGGVLFLGDMKSAELRDLFYRTCVIKNGKYEDIEAQASQRKKRDFEFYISGDYLCSLMEKIPRIKGVKMLLKKGVLSTEMNLFRFDAVLYLDSAPSDDYTEINCKNMNIDDIRKAVTENGGHGIRLIGIRNKLLEEETASSDTGISLYAADVINAAESLGYSCLAVPHDTGLSRFFDAELIRTGE